MHYAGRDPVPIPAQISCPICSCVFRQHQKHLHMAKHVAEKHPGCETFLKCPVCSNKFTNAKSAGRHKCDPQSSPANLAKMVLHDDYAIYRHPPGQNVCPLCPWITQAKEMSAILSIERHLQRTHNRVKPVRNWQCRSCQIIMDG